MHDGGVIVTITISTFWLWVYAVILFLPLSVGYFMIGEFSWMALREAWKRRKNRLRAP